MTWARLVAACAVVAVTGATLTGIGPDGAEAQTAPGLRLGPAYEVTAVDSPSPTLGGRFGQGLYSPGDLDDDGVADLLAPQVTTPAGQVIALSGATGEPIYVLDPPEPSDPGTTAATFHQWVGSIRDIGSCPGGAPSVVCNATAIGPRDGVADLLLSSPGYDFPGAPDIGRAYLFDGATGAVLKKIDMPAADRADQAAVQARPGFGRTVMSPWSPWDAGGSALGDLDDDGWPDIVVGASTYFEAGPATNPSCDPGPCASSGRVYFYSGAAIAGSDPAVPIDTPYATIKNPLAQTDDPGTPITNVELLGHVVVPVGDVGGCTTDPGPGQSCPFSSKTTNPDGRPEIMASAYRTDYPAGFADTGVGYLVDGATGAILHRYEHPQPQQGVLFTWLVYNQHAVGDVGDSVLPDILLPSFRQNVDVNAQGRVYSFSGNFRTHPVSMLFSQLDDPTPANGGNFGAPIAALGDVAGDTRNEVLVGALGPFIPGNDTSIVNDIHVFSPNDGRVLASFEDPDDQPGSGFGAGIASLGDVNGDGFVDFAAAAGLYDSPDQINQGRVYIFTSTAEIARTVSLKLSKHVVATGRVSAPDASECAAGVPVKIKRKAKTVGRAVTGDDGRYKVRLEDRTGRYRAVAPEAAAGGLTCLPARSKAKRHRH